VVRCGTSLGAGWGGAGVAGGASPLALALDDRRPGEPEGDTTGPTLLDRGGRAPAPAADRDATGSGRVAGAAPAGEAPAARPAPAVPATAPTPAPDPAALSLTADELAHASGLSVRDVRDLERFGLLEGQPVGDDTYYDGDALVIARTAAGFLQHGIEARHMRTYKVAIDREAGLFEQIVLPVLKQRNPEARRRAAQTVAELMRLGDDMRNVLLRRELRDHLPPG